MRRFSLLVSHEYIKTVNHHYIVNRSKVITRSATLRNICNGKYFFHLKKEKKTNDTSDKIIFF